MGRVLCLDFGRKRIGVALSDPLQLTAQPVDTWIGLTEGGTINRIQAMLASDAIEHIVIGYPLTMRGKRGAAAQNVERFIFALSHAVAVPVSRWDERLSSVQAQRILERANARPSRSKARVDVLAAVLILQSYLDAVGSRRNRKPEARLEP